MSSYATDHDRLAELIVELSGAGPLRAQVALEEARFRHRASGDELLNVADAIIMLRKAPAALTSPE